MPRIDLVPFDHDAQRATEGQWLAAVTGVLAPGEARPLVRASWDRSQAAAVAPDLRRAPLALATDALDAARDRVDWLPFARRAVDRLHGSYGVGHVLTMFDAAGRMLSASGDPHALDGLAEINFRPGGDWNEATAGTNGPGTALALGRPVHIVGAEHFCAQWQSWHCAAVPLRDQVTGETLGALDVSGRREHAHPHTLDLVVALGVAVEQMLAARDIERRYAVMHRMLELSTRYPGDALLAVDRGGALLFATGAVPERIRTDGALPPALRRAAARATHDARDAMPREVALALADHRGADDATLPAVCFPVLDGLTPVGACLLVREWAPARAVVAVASRATPAAATPVVATTRYTFADLVGESTALADARRVANAAAANTLPVLLTGESGTGKEIVAQSIHRASARGGRPFVAVNCAALPRELVESELFGYVGGAFSGARREGSPGKFVAADGGTIFLDEIGELPPTAQAALLRVLQEGEVTAVGATAGRRVDVRVIAATNRDLASCLAGGVLRADLYYRLHVLGVHLPPLRERRADIAPLAHRFLAAAEGDLGRVGHSLAPEVVAAFECYAWPGNVRELKNLVRRLVALAPAHRITLADLPPELRAPAAVTAPRLTPPDDAPFAADAEDADAERARTVAAVAGSRTVREAALRLGVTRSTLYRRLARYGLHVGRAVRD